MYKKIIFFNPYANSNIKGAYRRILFLSSILKNNNIDYKIILEEDFNKLFFTYFFHKIKLLRFSYFLYLIFNKKNIIITEVILAPVWRKNIFLTIHDLKAFNKNAARHGFLSKMIYWVAIKLSKKIIVVSEATKHSIINFCNVKSNKISVIPNGLSDSWLEKVSIAKEQEKIYDFIYVSSFSKHKNHDLFIRALPENSKTLLIGQDLGSLYEIMAAISNIENNITVDIRSNINSDQDLIALLKSAKYGVFPSLYEGFGIPILEYASCNLQIIASDIPPFRELEMFVDYFFPPDDEICLKNILLKALNLKSEDNSKERKTQSNLQLFTEKAIERKFLDCLGRYDCR